jgi:hypothetical protein
MKRPSTASAGLNFLKQGYSIELSASGVGAFLRFCERNHPGLKLDVTYENDMAVIKPVIAKAEVPTLPDSLKVGLQREGNVFSADLKAIR